MIVVKPVKGICVFCVGSSPIKLFSLQVYDEVA